MKLKSLTIKNFRAYKSASEISFDDLTTIIGKNDIGKSTILEALELFFNNKKIDPSDANVVTTDKRVYIKCEFIDFPQEVTIDSSYPTNLKDEYLLSEDNTLIIEKVYDCSKKTPTVETFIIANHPTANGVSSLLEMKEKDLQKIIKKESLESKLKGNPLMRGAIWGSVNNLDIKKTHIPVSKPKEDAKQIWQQIESYLPYFALFQSDRSSNDSDSEVQDPMKAAIAAAIADAQSEIYDIQKKVKEKAEEIATNTHNALKEIDENLASKLEPKFEPPTPAKWKNLFSISLDTDDGIPLNKRGSGVRRMILVSFFKAEAERLLKNNSKQNIIYAIEEPETAQHPDNQKILIESFKSLSNQNECQIILTTHSPGLASELPIDSLRFIRKDRNGSLRIDQGDEVFPIIADSLGVTPDSRVKVLCYVEGPTDIVALKCLSNALNDKYSDLPNLKTDNRVAFVLSGGSTLEHWVNHNYLEELGKPQFHLYDNDVKKYQDSIDKVNNRPDNSYGVLTKKLEIESYLHKDAIKAAFDLDVDVPDFYNNNKATPQLFGEAYSKSRGHDKNLSDGKAKKYLSERAFPKMTANMIEQRDPDNEVKGWFEKINEYIEN